VIRAYYLVFYLVLVPVIILETMRSAKRDRGIQGHRNQDIYIEWRRNQQRLVTVPESEIRPRTVTRCGSRCRAGPRVTQVALDHRRGLLHRVCTRSGDHQ
jgi:hypothetical protein